MDVHTDRITDTYFSDHNVLACILWTSSKRGDLQDFIGLNLQVRQITGRRRSFSYENSLVHRPGPGSGESGGSFSPSAKKYEFVSHSPDLCLH